MPYLLSSSNFISNVLVLSKAPHASYVNMPMCKCIHDVCRLYMYFVFVLIGASNEVLMYKKKMILAHIHSKCIFLTTNAMQKKILSLKYAIYENKIKYAKNAPPQKTCILCYKINLYASLCAVHYAFLIKKKKWGCLFLSNLIYSST